jgi:hypothetical protein
LHSFSLGPGWVHTDVGDAGAVGPGVDNATREKLMISVDESCDGMMRVLAKPNKAQHGGKLVLYTGDTVDW